MHTGRQLNEPVIRELIDNSLLAVGVTGIEGNLLEANPRFYEIFRIDHTSAPEERQLTLRDLMLNEDYLEILKSDEIHNRETLFKAVDGSRFTGMLSFKTTEEPAGKVLTVLDISEEGRLEQNWQRAESRYEKLFEQLHEGVVMHRPDGSIMSANNRACELLGLSFDQLIGRRPIDESWYTIHRDGSPYPGEEHPASIILKHKIRVRDAVMGVRKSDSSFTWLLINGNPIEMPGFEAPGALVSFSDITQYIETEKKLAEDRQRFNAIIEATHDGIWEWDMQTGELYMSPQYLEMLGYRPGELPQRFEEWKERVHPDDINKVLQHFDDYLAGRVTEFNATFRFRHREGYYIYVLSRGFIHRDENGEAVKMTGSHVNLTDRVLLEEKLRAESENFYQIIDFLPVGLVIIDQSGDVLLINRMFTQMTGYTANDIGHLSKWWQLAYPDEIERDVMRRGWERDFREAMKKGEDPPSRTRRISTRDGRDITVKMSFAHRRSNDILVSFEDVTDIERARETIEQRERQFKEMFMQHSAVMLLIDPEQNNQIVEANKAAIDFYGYSREELLSMNIRQVNTLTPDEISALAKKVQSGELERLEFPHRLKNGSIRDVEVFSKPITRAGKTILFSIIHDVTGRKKVERQIQRTLHDLREQRSALEAILNNSTVGIAFMNADRQLVRLNPRFAEIFGYTLKELQGQSTRLFYRNESDFKQFATDHYPRLVNEGTVYVEQKLVKKDGSEIWASLSGSTLAKGQPESGYVWVVDEITERKEYEKEILNARERAEEASAAKTRFLANISHEIRTPINAILGFSELLKESRLESREAGFADAVYNSGHTLLSLVNDLLDFSKIESDRLQVSDEQVNVKEILQQSVELFSLDCEKKGIKLNLNMRSELPGNLVTDGGRLRQILLNLIGNAVKFTQAGSITVELSISESGNVVINVIDTGSGIRPEEQSLIFNPFDQGSNPEYRHSGGTGLGLAITRKLTSLLGGRIYLCSEPGRGSTFTVVLYRPQWARPDEKVVDESSKSGFRKGSLLIIDDEEMNRQLFSDYLIHEPVEVLTAADGKEGIRLAVEKKPCLVLIDMLMPGMDGKETAEALRDNPATAGIPRVLVSAADESMTRSAEKDDGLFTAVLPKPVRKAGFLRFLRHYFTDSEKPVTEKKTGVSYDRMVSELKKKADKKLLRKIEKVYESAEKAGSFDAAAQLGTLLKKAALDYSENDLLQPAEELSAAAAVFDVIRIREILNKLQKLASQPSQQ